MQRLWPHLLKFRSRLWQTLCMLDRAFKMERWEMLSTLFMSDLGHLSRGANCNQHCLHLPCLIQRLNALRAQAGRTESNPKV